MESITKEVIKYIDNQGCCHDIYFGYNVASLLFPKGEMALLRIQKHYVILLPEGKDATDSIKCLIELFSYLKDMEGEHIIYVQQGSEQQDDFILYERCGDMRWIQASRKYDLGDGSYLLEEGGRYHVVSKDGKKILIQNVIVDFLSEEIERYFCGRIYPTTALKRYIERGFLIENEYYNNTAQKLSLCSIVVALVIACLSPLIILWLSNKWGKSTITESQYSPMMEMIEKQGLPNTVDSMIMEKLDSIKKVIEGYEQDSIKFIQRQ